MVQAIPRPGDIIALRPNSVTRTWARGGYRVGGDSEYWSDSSLALALAVSERSLDFVWVHILLRDKERSVLWNTHSEMELYVVET